MRRTIKTFLLIGGIAASSLLSAWGYALLGPKPAPGGDSSWQTPSLGYALSTDQGTPRNIGEEYRPNTPVVYYAYDANFLDYFGSNGVVAVDGAFTIMNALTNVDDYSQSLSEFPPNSQESFDSRALGLTDLRSTTLGVLMEQMGLAEPERYIWTLHDRYLPAGGTCPLDQEYLVIQRNYDPVSQVYSSYINDVLYTYGIAEDCQSPSTGWKVAPPWASPPVVTPAEDSVAFPTPVDVDAYNYTAVADMVRGLRNGDYYTGLTRDDVGGLRYLLSTNNMNVEDPAPGSELAVTNFNNLQLLVTSDLGALLQFAQTNPPAAVQAAFPDLVIDSYSDYFTIVSNPVIVAYFTNFNGSPAGTPPVLIIATNGYTYTPQTNYVYTFDNLVIVHYHTNTPAQEMVVTVTNLIGAPAGTPPYTNTMVKNIILTNVPSGDYYVIPPGSCGYDIVSTLRANNLAGITTNVIAAATNFETGFVGSESIVTYFTNNWFQYYSCNFQPSSAQLYQGVKKIQFVRADYDSLLSQTWNPVTNYYSMVTVTNGRPVVQYMRRIVTQPDMLFSAEDLTSPNGNTDFGFNPLSRSVSFDQNHILNGLAGPGTITFPSNITFNKVGDLYGQSGLASQGMNTNQFLSEANQEQLLTWGSYDNSTNAPIVYPDGASIQNLEYQIFIQISPLTLPDGTNGTVYPTTSFTTTGGSFTPTYTWSLAIDPSTQTQTVLPKGLTLSPDGTISGTPTGNPSGVYDFIITMTDSIGRSVTWNYSITIH